MRVDSEVKPGSAYRPCCQEMYAHPGFLLGTAKADVDEPSDWTVTFADQCCRQLRRHQPGRPQRPDGRGDTPWRQKVATASLPPYPAISLLSSATVADAASAARTSATLSSSWLGSDFADLEFMAVQVCTIEVLDCLLPRLRILHPDEREATSAAGAAVGDDPHAFHRTVLPKSRHQLILARAFR